MPDRSNLQGQVLDASSHKGVEGVIVELWNKSRPPSKLASTATTRAGVFELSLASKDAKKWASKRNAKGFFKVLKDNELLLNTESVYTWDPTSDAKVVLEVAIPVVVADTVISTVGGINSFDELMQQEKDVLEIIRKTRNGGNLFMAHPILFLKEVAGLNLTERALRELISREPILESLSEDAFRAIKGNSQEQHIKFEIRGLFKK